MNLNINIKEKRDAGFTLLELLIVISIIAILSVALVLVLNPAETLRKSRDAQRISDLSTIKTALGIMLTSTSTPSLDGKFAAGAALTICTTDTAGTLGTTGVPKIQYSSASASPAGVTPGADSVAFGSFATTGGTGTASVSGGGWIPAVLSNLVGGSPISNYPIDPTNSIGATNASYSYRYACQNSTSVAGKPSYVFEIDAILESAAYGAGGADDKSANDGGDNNNYYEVGNSLKLLPATVTTF